MQVFGKPYQTALALLSLDHCSREYINRIFFIIEPALPGFEKNHLQKLANLVPGMQILMPEIWIGLDSYDPSRMKEIAYRRSIRYQYDWELSEADFLLLIHNDVIFKNDIVAPFLANIGNNIGIGQIGQCWNCPVHSREIVERLGLNNGRPCSPESYADFKCDYAQLLDAYKLARKNRLPLRWKAVESMQREYQKQPWPLPECRLNEWCALINLRMAREATAPRGKGRPIGAYQPGQDLGVAWFRDMCHLGHTFRHMDIASHVEHTPGHKSLFNEQLYVDREKEAASLIKTAYPEKVADLRERGFSL